MAPVNCIWDWKNSGKGDCDEAAARGKNKKKTSSMDRFFHVVSLERMYYSGEFMFCERHTRDGRADVYFFTEHSTLLTGRGRCCFVGYKIRDGQYVDAHDQDPVFTDSKEWIAGDMMQIAEWMQACVDKIQDKLVTARKREYHQATAGKIQDKLIDAPGNQVQACDEGCPKAVEMMEMTTTIMAKKEEEEKKRVAEDIASTEEGREVKKQKKTEKMDMDEEKEEEKIGHSRKENDRTEIEGGGRRALEGMEGGVASS